MRSSSSYNVSSPYLTRSPVTSRFDFTGGLNSPRSTTFRDSSSSSSFNRFSPQRETLPASFHSSRRTSHDSRSHDPPVTRSPLSGETTQLLELYGARKTSTNETSAQSYLKQRKQSEPDGGSLQARRTSLVDSSYGAARDSMLPGPSSSSGYSSLFGESSRRPAQTTPVSDLQSLSQNDYMNRLLAAHNRVDDLLKSRGLNSDDENKYLRAWEQIPYPAIREERVRRLRSPSNSSDSGLSTDNDSDRSNVEPAVTPPEQPEPESKTELTPEPEIVKEEEPSEEDTEVFNEFDRKPENLSCKHTFLEHPKTSKLYFSCKAVKNSEAKVSVPLSRHIPSERAFGLRRTKPEPPRQNIELKCVATQTTSKDCSAQFKRRQVKLGSKEQLMIPARIVVSASFSSPSKEEIKKTFTLKRRSLDTPQSAAQLQKALLANLKPVRCRPIPSSAEISIQHCSFYQVAKTAKADLPEKNVRINLRLTERAPKNCAALIILPAPPKYAFVRLDIPLSKKWIPRRTKSNQQVTKDKKIGKLDRSYTVELVDGTKEQRKVSRLKIPEFFLQQSAETYEDISGVRNKLKKVPAGDVIIGGFVCEPKPQPQLRRVGAIRRKPAPPKTAILNQLGVPSTAQQSDLSEPFADFLPTVVENAAGLPLEKPPDPPPGKAPRIVSANHLNLPGSLERTATSSGALSTSKKESTPIAELSETDRLLVEQFRRSLHIPRPKLFRAMSPFRTLRCLITQERSPPVHSPRIRWIRRQSPSRLPKIQVRSPSPPPRLARAYQQRTKLFSKRVHIFEIPFTLKKVDNTKPRPKLPPRKRRLPKWVPRWRKKCSEEEVEEVEEEEIEEEEDHPQEKEDHPESEDEVSDSETSPEEKTSRPKNRSFNDGDSSLTEGEKAIAAVKKRHAEVDDAKLLDYEERRRIEREQEEETLRKLKEKQERRRLEREQQEREMEEKRKGEEERRRKEEEERKAKQEEERKRREDEKNKKQQFTFQGGAGRNFTIPKKTDHKADMFGNIVQAKQEMGMTKDQQEQAKQAFLATVTKSLPQTGQLLPADLKNKIKELHQRICRLEAEKYDLEKRHERQEYNLKELNERQRQVARSNAVKKGLDPAEAGSSKHPPRVRVMSKFERATDFRSFGDRRNMFTSNPKVQIVSKYDRQFDRRNFTERRSMYENRNAHPCFPGVPPPPVILEKVILKFVNNEELSFDHETPELARGSARPPPEWRKKSYDDVEAYLNCKERRPSYIETIENMASSPAKSTTPPRQVKKLRIPEIFG